MFNILVANEDLEQRESYCQYLKNTTNSKVIGVDNGLKALNAYNELNPSAFILDTKLNNPTSSDILDKLSSTKKEAKTCNIILTTNIDESIYPISNTSKIYKILFKPFEYSDLKGIVLDIYNNNKIPVLDELTLQLLLIDLKFNINSWPTKYLIEAIYQCYYYPYLLSNLDDIADIVAYKFNKERKSILAAFRNSLRPLNNCRNIITQSEFIKLFDKTRNISPKYFLEVITSYLYKQNKKSP